MGRLGQKAGDNVPVPTLKHIQDYAEKKKGIIPCLPTHGQFSHEAVLLFRSDGPR
jgi:hypothetical protein